MPIRGGYGTSGPSGDCSAEEPCKSSGTGPSCLDKSIPANENLKDNKQKCLKDEEKECTKAKVSCMKECVTRELETLRQCEGGPQQSNYFTRATWMCRSICDRPSVCNYLKCFCLQTTCTSCLVGDCKDDPAPTDPTTPDPPDDPSDPGDGDTSPGGGPRVMRNNMRVTRSNYDVPIETVYTRHIVAGNVIWIGNFENAQTTSAEFTTGGEGPTFVDGIEANEVRESFFDFALALGTGELDAMSRLWINGDLVIDRTSELLQETGGFFGRDVRSTANYRARGTDITLYRGTETQRNNPYMDGGVAYRGLAYLFFRRYPLRYSNGKFPSISVEVYRSTTNTPASSVSAALPTLTAGDALFHADGDRGLLTVDGSLLTTPLIDPNVITTIPLSAGADAIDNRTIVVTPSGAVVAQVGPLSNTRPAVLFNPLTGAEAARFGITGGATSNSSTELLNTAVNGGTYSIGVRTFNKEYYVAVAGTAVAFLTVDPVAQTLSAPVRIDNGLTGGAIQHAQFVRYTTQRVVGRTDLRESCVFLTSTDASVNAITMHELVMTSSDDGTGSSTVFPHNNAMLSHALPASAWEYAVGTDFVFAFYDGGADLGWIIGFTYPTLAGTAKRIIRYSMKTRSVVWQTTVTELPHNAARLPAGPYPSNFYEFIGVSGTIYRLDRRTGVVFTLQASPLTQNGRQYYNAITDSILVRVLHSGSSKIARLNTRRLTANTESVGAVVADLLRRSGFAEDEFDVTDLEGLACAGFKVSVENTVLEVLAQLGSIYMFSQFFANGALTFSRRATSPAVSVAYGDIAAPQDQNGSVIELKMTNEVSQLREISVVYSDGATTNLTEGTQQFSAKEAAQDSSGTTQVVVTFAVLTATYARQLLEVLYTEANERGATVVVHLPPKYGRLAPADYLVFSPNISDLPLDWRIQKVETGADLSLQITLRQDSKDKYVNLASIAPVITPDVTTDPIELPPVLQRPYLFTARWYGDMTANPNGLFSSTFYALATRTTPVFPPTALYRNVNGFLSEIGTVTKPGHVGVIVDFPAIASDNYTRQDEASDYLVVRFPDPEVVTQLSNSTDLNAFRDVVTSYTKNVLFAGKEIIQYGTYEVAGDGVTVTFRKLFRGRRGTDLYIGTAVVGTSVVVYDPAAVLSFGVANIDADARPVAVSTAAPFNGSTIIDTYQIIGDTESTWALPPKTILRSDVAPPGFITPSVRKMFFNAYRRATEDTELANADMRNMDFSPRQPLIIGIRRAVTREYFFNTIFGTPGTLGADWTGQMGLANGWNDAILSTSPEALNNSLHGQNHWDLNENPFFNPTGYNHLIEPLTLVFAEPVLDTSHSNSWYWMGYWPAGQLAVFTPPQRIEIWKPLKVIV